MANQPTLYGMSGSRALRSIWAIEEAEIDYTHVPTHFMIEVKEPDYLEINPNGRVPCLVDGELTLFESMAINLYIAEKYAPHLLPEGLALRAQAMQWSVWVMTEIEQYQMNFVTQRFFRAPEERDEEVLNVSTEKLQRPLKVLDAKLASQPYLLGETFSIADLNVAGVMRVMFLMEFDLSAYANVTDWLKRCYDRPAFERAQSKDNRPFQRSAEA